MTIRSYFGDPASMGYLSNFRALIPRPFSPTGCHLFLHQEALLFRNSSSSLMLLFLILGCFIHHKQRLGCILNDANIKLTLNSWNQFQKWNHFLLCSRVDPKNLMGLQLIKIFRALPGIRRSNTVCTRTHHLSRSPLNESGACPPIPHFSSDKYNSRHVNKERETNPRTVFTLCIL